MLRELRIDCDGDALLLIVEQTGPACHTGQRRCFYLKVDGDRVTVTDAPERRPEQMYRPRSEPIMPRMFTQPASHPAATLLLLLIPFGSTERPPRIHWELSAWTSSSTTP